MINRDPLAAWRSNPFFVLGVPTDAAPGEVERAGQRLLALLTVGSVAAVHYDTPLGPACRDADMVRQALAGLRDPEQRMLHELWASVSPPAAEHPTIALPARWEAADRVLGWMVKWVP
jgi:hypothetical protein